MKLINANRKSADLTKVAEGVQAFIEQEAKGTVIKVIPLSKDQINAHADSIALAVPMGGSSKGYVAKVFVLTNALQNVVKRPDANDKNFTFPALPSDICGSQMWRKEVFVQLKRALNVGDDKDLAMLIPSSTPIYLDLTDEANIENLASTMFNDIALKMLEVRGEMPQLAFSVGSDGSKEKLSIAVAYNSSHNARTSAYGFPIRNDISVQFGKVTRSNDNLNHTASSEYGHLAAYTDVLYQPRQVGQPNGWNMNAPKVPYLTRLIMRHFEGPDGVQTLAHDLLGIAGAGAIIAEPRAILYSLYPEYDTPKDSVSERNLGALAADVEVTGKQEYIDTTKKSFTPEMYAELAQRLLQPQPYLGMWLNPFGPRATTHQVFYAAAAGAGKEAQAAVAKIVAAASKLTNDKFPANKWANRSIFMQDSMSLLFDGTYLDPKTGTWRDLANLQDCLTVANRLLSDPKAGSTELNMYREFADVMLPNKGDIHRSRRLLDILTVLQGAQTSDRLRINDVAFVPLINPEFVTDLQAALASVVDGKLHVTAPNVVLENQRGQSAYSFNTNDAFTPGQVSGGFGTDNGTGGWGNGWSNFGGSNSNWN